MCEEVHCEFQDAGEQYAMLQTQFANNAKYGSQIMMKEIEVFIAVVTAGNFSAAARQLDVAVSSVTRRIDTLEADLGVTLFRRGSRRVVLTDAGMMFVETAHNLVAELVSVRELLTNHATEPGGTLTLTAPAAFGRRHVAPAVQTFLEKYPQMEVDLHLSDRVVDLAVDRVDLAVRIGRLADSDLVASKLAPLRRVICASPAYLKKMGLPVAPKDLVRHECLTVTSKPTPLGWWTFTGSNRGAPLPIKGRLRSDDTEVLLQAALDGCGIVHLATWMVGDALRAGSLVRLLQSYEESEDGTAGPSIYVVRLPGRSHAQRARLFLNHLLEHVGESPYWDRTLDAS